MTLSLPKEKLLQVQNHCQEILEKEKIAVRELSKLIGRFSMKIVLKFKIIHYYICYIVGIFYIELLYWRNRMRGVVPVWISNYICKYICATSVL